MGMGIVNRKGLCLAQSPAHRGVADRIWQYEKDFA